MKVYVSGPMTGIPDLNFPLFRRVTDALRAMGHEVVSPVETNDDPNAQWLDCIAADVLSMRGCRAICFLPGYERSKGARIEAIVAEQGNMATWLAEEVVPHVFEAWPA